MRLLLMLPATPDFMPARHHLATCSTTPASLLSLEYSSNEFPKLRQQLSSNSKRTVPDQEPRRSCVPKPSLLLMPPPPICSKGRQPDRPVPDAPHSPAAGNACEITSVHRRVKSQMNACWYIGIAWKLPLF